MKLEELRQEHHSSVRTLELFCIREYIESSMAKEWDNVPKQLINQLGASAKDSFGHYLESGLSFVAQEDDEIAGFIFAQMVEHIYNIPKLVWVENLGVHPSMRRQGIGYRLLEKVALTGRERGARAVHSSIMPHNKRSIMLHKKLSFFIDARKIAFLDLESSEF